jgi:TM2 domain-containing membrane protein YozV
MSIVPADKKIPAGILAILLGGLGIHKFYLGATNAGIIMLSCFIGGAVLAPFTCGLTGILPGIMGVIGLVEGIIYLTKSDSQFYSEYQIGHKPWF